MDIHNVLGFQDRKEGQDVASFPEECKSSQDEAGTDECEGAAMLVSVKAKPLTNPFPVSHKERTTGAPSGPPCLLCSTEKDEGKEAEEIKQ